MKLIPQNQSRKTRQRSPAYALSVVFLGCLLVLGILGLATPSQSSSAGADRSSMLVPNPSTHDAQAKSADGLWRGVEQSGMAKIQQQRADLRSFRTVALDQDALAAILHAAPMEFSAAAAEKRLILTLPDPDGTFARFSIAESPIMEPGLAARFPEIRTYTGQGIDDPTATTRFDWTPLGFHAIVLSEKGTILIEPRAPATLTIVSSIFREMLSVQPGNATLLSRISKSPARGIQARNIPRPIRQYRLVPTCALIVWQQPRPPSTRRRMAEEPSAEPFHRLPRP